MLNLQNEIESQKTERACFSGLLSRGQVLNWNFKENQGAIKVKAYFSEQPKDRSLVSMYLLLRTKCVHGFLGSVLHPFCQRD